MYYTACTHETGTVPMRCICSLIYGSQAKANVNGKRVSGHPPACGLEGRIIWPLLSLLCTAHAQYNYHGLSKHPVFDMYRKCLNCTGNVEVK